MKITIRDTENQFHSWPAADHVLFENDRGVQVRRIVEDESGNARYLLVGSFQRYIFAKITEDRPPVRLARKSADSDPVSVVDTDEFTLQDMEPGADAQPDQPEEDPGRVAAVKASKQVTKVKVKNGKGQEVEISAPADDLDDPLEL